MLTAQHVQLHTDVVLLRAEMKTCSTEVAKLTKEFNEFKKVVEATRQNVDCRNILALLDKVMSV